MATVGVPYTSSFVTMEMKTLYTPMEEHALQIQWIADQSNENPRQQ